jgi:hypothetical protein
MIRSTCPTRWRQSQCIMGNTSYGKPSIHWLSFNMQFVNIYVRADSSIIETDNIWHYKHILQYIMISNHHYFPVCNQNCVMQYYFRTYTGNCWATYTETCVPVFMLFIFIHSNFHVIRTLSYDCSIFVFFSFSPTHLRI